MSKYLATVIFILLVLSSLPTYYNSDMVFENNQKIESQIRNLQTETINNTLTHNYLNDYYLPETFVPTDIVIDDNYLWFSEINISRINRLSFDNQTILSIELPETITPLILEEDVDGSIWFSDNGYTANNNTNYIGKFNTTSFDIEYFPLPTSGAEAMHITIEENYIWFTEWRSNQIGRFDKVTHEIIEIDVPCSATYCSQIGILKSGENIWFADYLSNEIGMMNVNSFEFEFYNLPKTSTSPSTIIIDSEDIIWTGFHGGDNLLSFDPESNEFENYYTKKDLDGYGISGITELIFDSNQNIWFSEHLKNSIGLFLKDSGSIMEYNLPRTRTGHQWLYVDGAKIWYAEYYNSVIGYIEAFNLPKIEISVPNQQIKANKGENLKIEFEMKTLEFPSENLEYSIFGEINNYYESISKFNSDESIYKFELSNSHTLSLNIPFDEEAEQLIIVVGIENDQFTASQSFIISLEFPTLQITLVITSIILLLIIIIKREFFIGLHKRLRHN